MRYPIATFLVLSLAFAAYSPARKIETWGYDRLFAAADLVVIATAKDTVETSAKSLDPQWGAALIGQDTTFTIDKVLQGRPPEGDLKVSHFRYVNPDGAIDGPLLVRFRTQPVVLGPGRVSLGIPKYMLFLKSTGKKSFEPISGQVDSELSVKEIYEPLPKAVEGR